MHQNRQWPWICWLQFSNLLCSSLCIVHKTGIPYNPQGQGIVQWAHQTLQHQLKKLKRGSLYAITPNNLLSHALFVLNFLSLDKNGKSAAQRLWYYDNKTVWPMVRWKDPIEGRWHGPDPVLIWGRGHVCVFPQNAEALRWLPERLVRTAEAIAGGTNEETHDPSDSPTTNSSADTGAVTNGVWEFSEYFHCFAY